MKRQNKRAFTIVELIIVIAVIGVLAAILIPTFANVISKANAKSALSDARNALTNILAENAERVDGNLTDHVVIIIEKAKSFYVYGYNVLNNEAGQLIESAASPVPAENRTLAEFIAEKNMSWADYKVAYDAYAAAIAGGTDEATARAAFDNAIGDKLFTLAAHNSELFKAAEGGEPEEVTMDTINASYNNITDKIKDMPKAATVFDGITIGNVVVAGGGTGSGTGEGGGTGGGPLGPQDPGGEPTKFYNVNFFTGAVPGEGEEITGMPANAKVTEGGMFAPSTTPTWKKNGEDVKTFDHWEENGSEVVFPLTNVTADHEITATWKDIVRYTLTFEVAAGDTLNLGTGVTNGMSILGDTSITAFISSTTVTPAAEHVDFVGWRVKDTDTIYNIGSVPALTMQSDLTLVAELSNHLYKITFVLPNAPAGATVPTMADHAAGDITLPTLTAADIPAGKSFGGWSDGVALTPYGANATYDLASDVTFTAVWVDQYKVEYYQPDGTTKIDDVMVNANTATTLKSDVDDTATGVFVGWVSSLQEDVTAHPATETRPAGFLEKGTSYTVTQNVTFTAVYETIKYNYTISFKDAFNGDTLTGTVLIEGATSLTIDLADYPTQYAAAKAIFANYPYFVLGSTEFTATATGTGATRTANVQMTGTRLAKYTDGAYSAYAADYVGVYGSDAASYQVINSQSGLNAVSNVIYGGMGKRYMLNADGLSRTAMFNTFTGTFDGNGKTVSISLSSASADSVGFFRANQGTIKNLTVTAQISVAKAKVGGITGVNQGTIENCTVTGSVSSSVSGNANVGGIAGYVDGGTVTGCKCSAIVKGTAGNYVGGIAGYLKSTGKLEHCTFTGDMSGNSATATSYLGGIVGAQNAGTTLDCHVNVTADIKGYQRVGGAIGQIDNGTMSYCTVNAKFVKSGNNYLGGFVGVMTGGTIEKSSTIVTSSVFGNYYCGGFAGTTGTAKAYIKNCFSRVNKVDCGDRSGGFAVNAQGSGTSYVQNSYSVTTSAASAGEYAVRPGVLDWGNATCNVSKTVAMYGSGFATGYSLQTTLVTTASALMTAAQTTHAWSTEIWDFSGTYPELKSWESLYGSKTVTFDANRAGATVAEGSPVANLDAQAVNSGNNLTLPKLACEGWTFKGWATSASAPSATYGTEVTTVAYANINFPTLYGVWVDNSTQYTVTINLNLPGGCTATVPENPIVRTVGTEITLPTPTVTSANASDYQFAGWSVGNANVPATYTVGGNMTFEFEANANLFAQWTVSKKYSIHFVEGFENVTNMPSDITDVAYKGSATVPDTRPTTTNTEYDFDYWLDETTSTQYRPGESVTNVTRDITLKGMWATVQHIRNETELRAINTTAGMTKRYVVDNDFTVSSWNTPLGWIGDGDVQFTGKFDGNGKTITISGAIDGENFGVFALNNGTITNLNLIVNYDNGGYTSNKGGAIAGQNLANGVISNCNVQLTLLKSHSIVGGIVGLNYGSIRDCHITSANLNAFDRISLDGGAATGSLAGGIVGVNYANATITRCSYSGVISAYGYATYDMQSQLGYVGGIAGWNKGNIDQCWVDGSVNPDSTGWNGRYIGGIAGLSSGVITNCWAYLGYLGSYQCMGGIAGKSTGTVSSCWALTEGGVVNNGDYGSIAPACSTGTIVYCYYIADTMDCGPGTKVSSIDDGAQLAGFDLTIWTFAAGSTPELINNIHG